MSESAIFPYPGHWELTTLGQLCIDGGGGVQTGPFGSQLHSADYVEVGIPSIMPKNISIEGVSTEDIARITEEDALRLSKYLVKEGDIVYSRRGDVEKCSLITQHEHGWLCGTGCLKVSLGENSKVPSSYIHAYLSHPAIREWISRHAIGATMPNLNTSILSAVPVLIPPTDEIDIIVGIWRNTTDKVVLNHQTNQTLEQIAQAIFKSWFVDFEPTRAKIIAKEQGANLATQELAAQAIICGVITLEQLEEIEQNLETTLQQAIDKKLNQHKQTNPTALNVQQLKTTAALFPNELVESELGDMPEGWSLGVLGDVLTQRNERIKASCETEAIPYVPIDCISPCSLFLEDYKNGQEAKSSLIKVYENDFIFGAMRPYFHKVCIAPFEATTRTTAFVLKPKNEIDFSYAILRLHEKETIDYANLHSTGSTIPYAKWKDSLELMEVILPSFELRKKFNQLVSPLLKAIPPKIFQNEALKEARDTLLPKLLSGELDVSALADNSEAGV